MKRVFVAIPPKYDMDTDETAALILQLQAIVHSAENAVDEYCELVCSAAPLDFLKKDSNPDKLLCAKGFVISSLYDLCNADFAIFAHGWQSSKECTLLYAFARSFGIPVLDMDNPEKAEENADG